MTGRVVVVGSLNVDIVLPVERIPGPGETLLSTGPLTRYAGGKGGNQAVAAASAGARTVMIAAVGDDEAGRAYAARLAGLGIDARLQVVAGEATGTAYICVDEAGENAIVVAAGANARCGAQGVDLGAGDVLLCQLEVPLETVAAAASMADRVGARVVVNAAPYAALPAEVLAVADPLIVNEHEAALLADSGLVPRSLLVTFGPAGAVWDADRVEGDVVPAGEVVDTTGAGDAFCGALAAVLVSGATRVDALAAACRAGADAVRRPGAQPDPSL